MRRRVNLIKEYTINMFYWKKPLGFVRKSLFAVWKWRHQIKNVWLILTRNNKCIYGVSKKGEEIEVLKKILDWKANTFLQTNVRNRSFNISEKRSHLFGQLSNPETTDRHLCLPIVSCRQFNTTIWLLIQLWYYASSTQRHFPP